MTTPTYATAITPPSFDTVRSDLLSRLGSATVNGWPPSAPQRGLVDGEAAAIQFGYLQNAILAYAASPSQVRQLPVFLVSQGYSAADAADIAKAWVDIVLEWYGVTRIPATQALWSIPLKATSTTTIDNTSRILVQAADGTIFASAQPVPVTLVGGGASQPITFAARKAGTSGNVIEGSISQVLSGPAGLSVDTNETQILTTPARDDETDAQALDRAQGRWGTLSVVLTADGWKYLLLTNVTTLTRVFVDDANPTGPGGLAISLANAVGGASAAEVAAAKAIATKYTIAGAGPVTITSAVALNVPISATLITDGTNPLAAAQGASALSQLAGTLDDWLYVDAVIAALMGVPGVKNLMGLSLGSDVKRPSDGVIVITPTIGAI